MSDSEYDWDNGSDDGWDDGFDGTGDSEPMSLTEDDSRDKVMSREDVRVSLTQLIEEVAQVLELPHDICVALLHAFKWDSEETTSAYLESPKNALIKIGLSPASLKLRLKPTRITEAPKNYTCPICMVDEPGMVVYALGCGHSVCDTCFRDYLRSNVVNDRNVFSTSCPGAQKCSFRVLRSDVSQLLSREELERFDAHNLQIYIDQNRSKFRQCPAPGCEFLVRSSSNAACVKCECGCEFCIECGLEGNHFVLPCDVAKKWKRLLNLENQSESWLADNAKQCGKCQALIQRDAGCNHMVCTACGHSFCWLCLKDWDSHPGNALYTCMKDAGLSNASPGGLPKRQKEVLRVHTIRHNDHELAPPPFGKDIDSTFLAAVNTSTKFARDVDLVVKRAHQVLAWTYPILYLQRQSNQRVMLEGFVIDLEKALDDLEQYVATVMEGSGYFDSKLISLEAYIEQRTSQLVPYLMNTQWHMDRVLLESIDRCLNVK